MALLGEMDVIQSVVEYLESEKRYTIEKVVRSVIDRGTDIIVNSPKLKALLMIEAKGQTSSKKYTSRFGDEFSKNQKEDHLGRALLRSLQYISQGKMAGIALPADNEDIGLVQSLKPALERLGAIVFLVKQDKTVDVTVGKLP
jgi:hypothetical protein